MMESILLFSVVAVPVGVYLVVRLGSAAFFKSKQQYDLSKGKHHG